VLLSPPALHVLGVAKDEKHYGDDIFDIIYMCDIFEAIQKLGSEC